jgi:pyruvate/2-oxoglutarate/acetoin dehydrogenase E1 component
MERTLRQTINDIMRNHLEKGYLAFGQCLTAVGWVNGTIPELTEEQGLIELPMSDVADSAFAVGAALVGKKPMFIIRYQGFNWFNAAFFTNYAAKSKELFNIPCPIFIRSLAMEGGMGPTAGSSHHGLYDRMPGINIVSPMTPNEYIEIYEHFMNNDDPMYVSEHRKSFDITEDLKNVYNDDADISIFPFSITRLEMEKLNIMLLSNGIKANIFHQLWIRPLKISDKEISYLKNSKYGGLVLDDDYVNGISKSVAWSLMMKSGKKVHVLALEEKTAGATPKKDNFPPSAEKILNYILNIMQKGN